MATETKKAADIILLPEGRLIVHALFERDVFTPEKGQAGEPKYKAVSAYEKGQLDEIEEKMAEFLEAKFGKKIADEWFEGGHVNRINPIKNGDEISAAREAKGKDGTATKGKLVLTADSIFNKDGQKGPGGFKVYGPDTSPIGITLGNTDQIYNGCYGIMAVTFSETQDYPRSGDRGIKCYLAAFQKTRDGEKLTSTADASTLFKPVGRAPEAEGGRRRRAG